MTGSTKSICGRNLLRGWGWRRSGFDLPMMPLPMPWGKWVSVRLRGLLALTQKQLGTAVDGKALAERVHMGDRMAKACFLVFGCQVRDALVPILEGFQPEVLCFGGQITRSGHLFLPPVEEYCRGAGIRILVTEDTSLRTLQGLTRI